jgi:hypothetical protein
MEKIQHRSEIRRRVLLGCLLQVSSAPLLACRRDDPRFLLRERDGAFAHWATAAERYVLRSYARASIVNWVYHLSLVLDNKALGWNLTSEGGVYYSGFEDLWFLHGARS